MTVKTRATLKSQFENGDVPLGSDYGDLIDSALNLAETGAQTMAGSLNVPSLNATTFSTTSLSVSTLTTSASANLGGTTTLSVANISTSNVTTETVSTANITTANTSTVNVGTLNNTAAMVLGVQTVAGVGTTQSGAAQIGGVYTILSASAGQTAFILTGTTYGRVFYLRNPSSTTALIYPTGGGQINSLGADNAYSMAANAAAIIFCESPGQFVTF